MKIRHRILILLALPLLALLFMVGPLSIALADVDRIAQKESEAKRVVSLTDEIYGLIGKQIVAVAGAQFGSAKAGEHAADKARAELRPKVIELNALVSGNQKMVSVVNRIDTNCRKHIDGWEELAQTYSPGEQKFYMAQFLERYELAEFMKVLYDQLAKDVDTLVSHYGREASEFQPQQLKNRENLRHVVELSVLLVFTFVLIAYVTTSKTTLARLQILMNNIRKFSRGEKSLEVLPGEDELAELDKAFREMSESRNRLEEKRKAMRAIVNHDLRSPLTSIHLRLDLLIDKSGSTLDKPVLDQLKRIQIESSRLVRLASTLLDVDKLEDGKVELNRNIQATEELIETATEAVLSLAERKSINFADETSSYSLSCDGDKVIQVLVNLLTNAIKFSPEKSMVVLKNEMTDDSFIRFSVLDQGPGIPASQVEKLFSKFTQFEQPQSVKQHGSGLGLYICKMLVEAQGGRLGYMAREGGGSCFWFELPTIEVAP